MPLVKYSFTGPNPNPILDYTNSNPILYYPNPNPILDYTNSNPILYYPNLNPILS